MSARTRDGATILIQKITGTPAEPRSPDDAEIEAFEDPHANAGDASFATHLEEDVSAQIGDHRRTKINKRDIAELQPSPQCPEMSSLCSQELEASMTALATLSYVGARFYRLMEERSNQALGENLLLPTCRMIRSPWVNPLDFVENELENPVAAGQR